jgi:hypothetical protein
MIVGKKKARFVGSCVAAAVLSVATSALAVNPAVGIPAQVEYLNTPKLYIQIGGVNYVGQTASPGCSLPSVSTDTIKIWTGLAQAALLAGKNVTLYNTTCNGVSYITDVVLVR